MCYLKARQLKAECKMKKDMFNEGYVLGKLDSADNSLNSLVRQVGLTIGQQSKIEKMVLEIRKIQSQVEKLVN